MIFVKKGYYLKAAVYFSDINNKCELDLPGYNENLLRESSYYLGVKYMQTNQIDSARISFELCNEVSIEIDNEKDEESGFRINAVLYLGKIADQTGNYGEAEKYYEQVLEMREYNKSHQKAERYLSKLKDKKKAGN
jgi:tetratricopeptide (TPR) repeat protein